MADLKLRPVSFGTDNIFLEIEDSVSGDIVGLSMSHIVAFEKASGSSDITLFADVTIPGQGNQAALFEVIFTGAEATAIAAMVGSQWRGSVTGTFVT